MTISDKLFPTQANNNYQGSKIAQYTFDYSQAIQTKR